MNSSKIPKIFAFKLVENKADDPKFFVKLPKNLIYLINVCFEIYAIEASRFYI